MIDNLTLSTIPTTTVLVLFQATIISPLDVALQLVSLLSPLHPLLVCSQHSSADEPIKHPSNRIILPPTWPPAHLEEKPKSFKMLANPVPCSPLSSLPFPVFLNTPGTFPPLLFSGFRSIVTFLVRAFLITLINCSYPQHALGPHTVLFFSKALITSNIPYILLLHFAHYLSPQLYCKLLESRDLFVY